jgi:hypothetical protein
MAGATTLRRDGLRADQGRKPVVLSRLGARATLDKEVILRIARGGEPMDAGSDPGGKGRGRDRTAANAAGAAFGRSREAQPRSPNLHAENILTIGRTITYQLSGRAVSGSDDERVETTGLNSGEVLATLMDLEMERHHSAIAGNQVPKVLRCMARRKEKDAPETSPGASGNEQGRVGEDIYKVARRTQTA